MNDIYIPEEPAVVGSITQSAIDDGTDRPIAYDPFEFYSTKAEVNTINNSTFVIYGNNIVKVIGETTVDVATINNSDYSYGKLELEIPEDFSQLLDYRAYALLDDNNTGKDLISFQYKLEDKLHIYVTTSNVAIKTLQVKWVLEGLV